MDSIGEALRTWQQGSRLQEAEKLAERVLGDPLVRKLRERYPELTDRTLRINLNKLYQMTNEYRNCKECPGLERCPNDMQGHSTRIECEETNGEWQLFDLKTPCSKWTAFEQQEMIRRRITSYHADVDLLGDPYDEEQMLDLDPERELSVNRVMQYVEETRSQGLSKRGLYLMGSFGTGKTYMVSYLLHKLAIEGFSGVIVYMPEFVEDAKALMMEPQKLKETLTLMKECDLLVFDDIGAENLSPWVRDHVLGAILNYRMNRKPTFYTSNHDLDSLEKHFSFTHKEGEELHKGQRLMDRIRPFVDVVHVQGHNQRGNG
ncbi:ATP-binding protein [Cohnella lubricantis]|uniref:ATP-binding protein n=1 Tax=Cohnella lubricantis TaxID=2163172 RepID=A0A841T9X9_9BACL|nr:ATP-binding protein [Cohnella lubricantis]MBB6678313.1 ATP-binding protein [Cohnella lubricantis]MBP2118516.1 primosomal protein DnaI [Cohnella lubricantis]